MKKIRIFLSNVIRVRKDSLPSAGIALFEKRLTFRNPLYYKNERYGRPNHGIEPELRAFYHDQAKEDFVMMKGYLSETIRILHANRYQVQLMDETRTFEEVDFDSSVIAENYGITWPYQSEALEEISKHRFGILVGPPHCGKRMLACKSVARRRVPALIIVKTKREFYQWRELVTRYLRVDDGGIGLIGDGHKDLGRPFTIAITLTLYKLLDQVESQTGFVIVDQCDRANLKTFFKVVKFNSPYLLGLASSSQRPDGLTRLMESYLGQRVHQMMPPDNVDQIKPILKIKATPFSYSYSDDWTELITALCEDADRNGLIVTDILEAVAHPGAKVLVISERIGHLERLLKQVKEAYGPESEIIRGATSDSRRGEVIKNFDRGKLAIIFLTHKSIETLGVKGASHLFVASPLKYGNHLTQIVGKLLGTGQGEKRGVIFDYRDGPAPLQNSLKRRLKIYRAMGAVGEQA